MLRGVSESTYISVVLLPPPPPPQLVVVRPYVSVGFPIRTHLFDLDNKCLVDPVRHTGYPIVATKATVSSSRGVLTICVM